MKILTQLLAGMMLVFGLLSTAHASSIDVSFDQFAVYQSDAPATDEDGEKKKEGEEEDGEEKKKKDGEEEPECE